MSVPLLTEALPGFRAWRVDREGWLHAAAWSESAWDLGVNVARCAHGAAHEAPADGCSCGLYAFHALHGQLRGEAVVGAIAAWGEMQVHADGFRAGRARVLALAEGGAAVERAAERYGVPLLPRETLMPIVAERCGVLPPALLATEPERILVARRGHDAERHLWAEPGGGLVTLGVGARLHEWLGGDVEATAAVEAGGVVLRLRGDAAEVRVDTGVHGRVADVNGSARGWAVRVEVTEWAADCGRFDWGPGGAAAMSLRGFEHLRIGARPDRPARSGWADVRDALRASRAPGAAFADAAALYDDVGIALGAALAGAGAHLGRLDCTVALAVREPDARLLLDLRPGGAALRCGHGSGARPDVTVELVGDDLRPLLSGRLDLARATGAGRLVVTGPRSRALTALAVLVGWTRRRLPEAVRA